MLQCNSAQLGTGIKAFRRKLLTPFSQYKSDAGPSSEMLVIIHKTTRRYIPENHNLKLLVVVQLGACATCGYEIFYCQSVG
jgi:hypothetical protein